MIGINRNIKHGVFSLIGAGLVLWQTLLPGYVLVEDMIFGPHRVGPMWTGLSSAAAPMRWLLLVFNNMIGGMVLQKMLLIGLFFCLFYFPLRWYPFTRGRYVASVFFVVNPFVYERMLAGQWGILVAYLLLWPVAYSLIKLSEAASWRDVARLFAALVVMGMFSLHLLTMSVIICALTVLVALRGESLKRFLIGAGVFALVSLYWIVPAIVTRSQSPLVQFGPEQWQAFATATDTRLGTIGNVASLYGFWGEHEYWVTQFISPKAHLASWVASLAAFGVVVGGGLMVMLADRSKRRMGIYIVGIGTLALIFSSGIAASPVQSINYWLFNHVGFWRGFRDSQKWSAILALIYAILAGVAASRMPRKIGVVLLCIVPIVYTWPMLFGFHNQLKPVQYPTQWAQADAILKQNPNCKALFLPWHQYYTPPWNHGLLTGNPAASYFSCQIVSGKNMELGDIESAGGQGADYNAIERAVTDNQADPAATIQLLRDQGITAIIWTDDVADEDQFSYPFLRSPGLVQALKGDHLQLFQISGIIQ